MATRNSKKDDVFDADKYIDADQHSKDMEELKNYIAGILGRLKSLEDKTLTNEAMANTIVDASKNAVKMKELFAEEIVYSLEKDSNVKEALQNKIEEIDRGAIKLLIKRVGFGIWTIVVAIISGLAVFFLKT